MDFGRPSGAFGLVRRRTHGSRRGLLSYAPLRLQRLFIGESALLPRALSRGGLFILLSLAAPVFAFEPMPPIMQKLLEVFPEENGRFVDEPFGSIEQMPKEARALFETFRVVVPTPNDIDKNLARLFSASSHFPIKKITRYDKEPGAPGLPGFRGAWCQTEDESQVGFSIVTTNQNRFLIWAKMGYYPAFANDSINPKVRDQYARDVSQYLAGIDFKVPDNEAPEAGGRGLPEWMDLIKPVSDPWDASLEQQPTIPLVQEIRTWDLRDVKAVVPTPALTEQIIAGALQNLYVNRDMSWIQRDYEDLYRSGAEPPFQIQCLTKLGFAQLERGHAYQFAIDRYGRVRRCPATGEGDIGISSSLHFPGIPLLSTGTFHVRGVPEWAQMNPAELGGLVCNNCSYFWAFRSMSNLPPDSANAAMGKNLVALGHFLRIMRDFDVSLDNVLIRAVD